MALANRDKDVTEQRATFNAAIFGTASGISAGITNPGIATGITFPLCTIPYPSTLDVAESVVWGLSGTPVHSLWIYRFAGGFTSIACGQTLTVTAFGTSGAQGYSLIAGNASTFPLLAGDQIVLYALGSGAAVASAQISLVIKATQDFKSHFGV